MVLDINSFFLAFIILVVVLAFVVGILYFLGRKWKIIKYLWKNILEKELEKGRGEVIKDEIVLRKTDFNIFL